MIRLSDPLWLFNHYGEVAEEDYIKQTAFFELGVVYWSDSMDSA